MSVRAYAVKKIITSSAPAFSVWHDDFIMDIASHKYGDEGEIGFVELERSALEQLKEDAEAELEHGKKPSDNFKEYETDIHDVLITINDCLSSFKKGEDYQLFDCH